MTKEQATRENGDRKSWEHLHIYHILSMTPPTAADGHVDLNYENRTGWADDLGATVLGILVGDEQGQRARDVQAKLARLRQHRAAGVIDLLSAATAEYYGATVLHYDADFDHIAGVTRQSVEWVAPAGSAD